MSITLKGILNEFHTRSRKLSQTCEFDKSDDEISGPTISGYLRSSLVVVPWKLKNSHWQIYYWSGSVLKQAKFKRSRWKLSNIVLQDLKSWKSPRQMQPVSSKTSGNKCKNPSVDLTLYKQLGLARRSCVRKNHFTRCCKSKNAIQTHHNHQTIRKIAADQRTSPSSKSKEH